MKYKWKPSKKQKIEFAKRMSTDEIFNETYNERKMKKAEKKRSSSRFNYETAGGEYIPTEKQNNAAFELLKNKPTNKQEEACNMVLYGYSCKEKIDHDFIHEINEYIRKNKLSSKKL